MPRGRGDFQLCFPRHQVHARGKRPVRALIGDLRRQVNRDPQRYTGDIQQTQKLVAAQIVENMRPEEDEILRGHFSTDDALDLHSPRSDR